MTREEERVERIRFRVTSEWRYAGRLELSVLFIVREGTYCILNSFIYIEPLKRFKYGSDIVELKSFSDCTSSRVENKLNTICLNGWERQF